MVIGQREYRLLSGGEDGVVMWWNILYTPISLQTKDDSMLSFVDPKEIENLKPCHEIYLSRTAQMYGIIIGQNVISIA